MVILSLLYITLYIFSYVELKQMEKIEIYGVRMCPIGQTTKQASKQASKFAFKFQQPLTRLKNDFITI